MIDDAAGDHETRIERASGNPPKRMPCPVIKPIPELEEAVGDEVFSCSEVEPRVDWELESVHVKLVRRGFSLAARFN